MNDLKVKGEVSMCVMDSQGNVLETFRDENLVVNGGKDALALLAGAGDPDKVITQISYGTNGAPAALENTAITGEYKKNLDGVTYPSTGVVSYSWSLGLAENNGVQIEELGLLCFDDTLFARKVRAPIDKTADIQLAGTWKIKF